MTLVELQNRDNQDVFVPVEVTKPAEPLTRFADDNNIDKSGDDDGEFIAIDTGTENSENYKELKELQELDEIYSPPQVKKSKSGEDIFDVLENLENIEDINLSDLSDLSDIEKFMANLNSEEFSTVEMLINAHLKNKNFDMLCSDFLTAHGVILESVIDIINEKALNFTGDIIFDMSSQEIIEDYRDEIEEVLQNPIKKLKV
jgi:hypothetical protein